MNTPIAGILYTIATPIGNLEDITLRALSVLKQVDVVVCEDTRETRVLLEQHGISGKKLQSYHAQSDPREETAVLSALMAGQSVGLVSDRGTPGISDPGSRLIARAVTEGIRVIPIPGASAVITALQAAGVDTSAFVYLGFMPHKKGRQTLFREIAQESRTVVFYESPHRLQKTLDAMADSGKDVIVARELTKVHEEFVRGTAAEVAGVFRERGEVKGECVVIVHAPRRRASESEAV